MKIMNITIINKNKEILMKNQKILKKNTIKSINKIKRKFPSKN